MGEAVARMMCSTSIPHPGSRWETQRCEGYTTPVELQMMPFIYDFGCRDLSDWRRPKVRTRKGKRGGGGTSSIRD